MQLMYGADTWTVTRREEGLPERREMRMLRWILVASLKVIFIEMRISERRFRQGIF